MSSKESLRNRLATLMDRHRALDKQVSDDYKNRIQKDNITFKLLRQKNTFYLSTKINFISLKFT